MPTATAATPLPMCWSGMFVGIAPPSEEVVVASDEPVPVGSEVAVELEAADVEVCASILVALAGDSVPQLSS